MVPVDCTAGKPLNNASVGPQPAASMQLTKVMQLQQDTSQL
jgi:hypothetical protein